jgi:hypothetical protein
MIGNTERSQIKQLIQSPQWLAIQNVAKELIAKLQGESRVKDTEWDTIKASLFVEGEIRGIELLFQELERQIYEMETKTRKTDDRDE